MIPTLIYSNSAQVLAARVKARLGGHLDIEAVHTREELPTDLTKFEIAFGSPRQLADIIDDCTSICWVQSSWTGVEPFFQQSSRRDYLLTACKGVFERQMAEYVFAYLLQDAHRLFERHRSQTRREWNQQRSRCISGQTMTVLGTGEVGSEVAKIAKAFNMTTVGYRREQKQAQHFDRIYSGDELQQAVSQAEYVVSALPHTEGTKGLITADVLRSMKSEAMFINIGRPSVVGEDDLAECLFNQEIRQAVLDVTRDEPLPKDSVLWTIPNLLLTFHTSGTSSAEAVSEVFCKNFGRYLSGEALLHLVEWNRGY